MQSLAQMWERKNPKECDHDRGWNGNKKCQTASMSRPKIVQSTDHQYRSSGEQLWMADAEILKCGKSADSGSDDVVRNQEKCSDDGDDLRPVPDAGIDSAAVRVMAADGHVVY